MATGQNVFAFTPPSRLLRRPPHFRGISQTHRPRNAFLSLNGACFSVMSGDGFRCVSMPFVPWCLSTKSWTFAVAWYRSMLGRRKHSAPTDAPTRSGLIRSSVRSFRSRRKRLPCNAKAAPGEVPRRTRAIPQALRAQIVHRRGERLDVGQRLTRPTDQLTVDFDIKGLPGYPDLVVAPRQNGPPDVPGAEPAETGTGPSLR